MTIDTNILIEFLNGDTKITEIMRRWLEQRVPFFVSTIVETELLGFSKMRGEERLFTEQFLEDNFISVSFDRPIARIAATIRQETKMKFPDAGIAATALFTHTPIVTRNVKDFQRVANLQIIKI